MTTHSDGTPSVVERTDTLYRIVWVLVAFVAFLVGAVILSVPQIIHSDNESTAANENATAAAADATKAVKAIAKQNKCLERFANGLADALDRRQEDSSKYQLADDRRDRILVKLFAAADQPQAVQERIAQEYLKATVAKQRALKEINEGRKAKEYPDPPREVCP